MIHSYNEEVKIKRRKNIIFWTIVFFLAWYLYLFFQGYYLNVDFNLKTPKKENLFKQFWIINIQVFPDQDDIKVNWIKYWILAGINRWNHWFVENWSSTTDIKKAGI